MLTIPNGIRVRDRHGETADFIRQGVVSAEQIGSALKPLLNKGAMLCTDGALAYKLITKQARESHQYFCRPADCKFIHPIQNVNAYNSRLKQWMDGEISWCRTRYIGGYLGWHR